MLLRCSETPNTAIPSRLDLTRLSSIAFTSTCAHYLIAGRFLSPQKNHSATFTGCQHGWHNGFCFLMVAILLQKAQQYYKFYSYAFHSQLVPSSFSQSAVVDTQLTKCSTFVVQPPVLSFSVFLSCVSRPQLSVVNQINF